MAEFEANKHLWADDAYAWLMAYMEAGFSREEALQIMVATQSRSVVQVGQTSPEMSELVTKMTTLLNRDLSE